MGKASLLRKPIDNSFPAFTAFWLGRQQPSKNNYEGRKGVICIKRLIGIIDRHSVWIEGSEIAVYRDEKEVSRQNVLLGMGHLLNFLDKAKSLRIGIGRLPDFDVIYLYDAEDDYFGYAVNLQAPDCSEWGYAPFGI